MSTDKTACAVCKKPRAEHIGRRLSCPIVSRTVKPGSRFVADMSQANDVVDSLRSWATVFKCDCGGQLWHIDGDSEGRLTCDSCRRYMVFGATTAVPVATADVERTGTFIANEQAFQLPLWP